MQVPQQFIDSLLSVPEFEAADFIRAHQRPAPTSIRLHPVKGRVVEEASYSRVPWCREGRYLPERPVFTTDPLLHAGAYYVQEASSMFVDFALRSCIPNPKNIRVLDLCAAPGGKSTLIASWLDEESLLLSNEVIRSRATILEENLGRWGYRNTWVCSNDPRDVGRIRDYFDVMVVDAPCSGSGLFRKDEKAILEWSPEAVDLCAARQQRILHDIYPALKQNGLLVYATCSYSQEEDEQILDRLAAEYGFESVTLNPPPEWGIVTSLSPRHHMHGYRFFPNKVEGEGFFLAVLRKTEGGLSPDYPRFRTQHDQKNAEKLKPLLADCDFSLLPTSNEQFCLIAPHHEPDYQLLKQFVYLRKAGWNVGAPGPKEWLPEHDLALSAALSEGVPGVELSLEEALLYLKKETFRPANTIAKGWATARYKGLGLGWIKVLDNRINNYLPKNLRIRMDIDWESIR